MLCGQGWDGWVTLSDTERHCPSHAHLKSLPPGQSWSAHHPGAQSCPRDAVPSTHFDTFLHSIVTTSSWQVNKLHPGSWIILDSYIPWDSGATCIDGEMGQHHKHKLLHFPLSRIFATLFRDLLRGLKLFFFFPFCLFLYFLFCPFSLLFAAFWAWKLLLPRYLQHFWPRTYFFDFEPFFIHSFCIIFMESAAFWRWKLSFQRFCVTFESNSLFHRIWSILQCDVFHTCCCCFPCWLCWSWCWFLPTYVGLLLCCFVVALLLCCCFVVVVLVLVLVVLVVLLGSA